MPNDTPDDAPVHDAPRRQRVNHFDKPKPPHDWRWVVGGAGRTLIVIGVLMFAFVAYQLWGTGIQTAQSQSRLKRDFEHLVTDTTTTAAPATTTTSAPPGTTTTVAGETTTTSTTVATVPAPVIPAEGDVVLKLEIPKIGLTKYVVEGVGTRDLRKGPGHYPETPLPGQLGNAAIAGHRTTYGAPFYDINELAPGDQIIATTSAGRYVYVVTGTVIVGSGDYADVIPTTNPAQATLTITSCHPRTSTRQRIVVRSELLAAESSPLSRAATSGTGGGTLPGDDDPAGGATTTAPSTTTPSTVASTGPTTTAAAAVATTVAPAPPTKAAAASGKDAFVDGWFSDSAAWVPVILWGALLLAVWRGAYMVARRTRRLWVGAAVGFVPFVVVLYFWFENVSRLLPPGL